MALEMMTTRFRIYPKKILIFLIFLVCVESLFCAEDTWIVSARKFDFARGQNTDGVMESFVELYPKLILDKIGNSIMRFVPSEELVARNNYESRKERLSLYLQLSSAYKKRDSIVLENLSEKELQKKLAEESIKIHDIENKIEENINSLKAEEEKILKPSEEQRKSGIKSESDKFSSFFKNMFLEEDSQDKVERVSVNRDKKTGEPVLFIPSDSVNKLAYNHPLFEKEIMSANIKLLLDGIITRYGDYMMVNVDAYMYPDCRLIGSVSEVGSINEIDWITDSLALQLNPIISNSQPVVLNINLGEEKDVLIYVDEKIQDSTRKQIVIDSGVHTLLFTKKDYRSVGTSFFFEGNRSYNIEVKMEPMEEKSVYLETKAPQDGVNGIKKVFSTIVNVGFEMNTPFEGELYANGSLTKKYMDNKSSIKINGDVILGQFVSENGLTAPFYVPEAMLTEDNYLSVNLNPIDRDKFIDVRRQAMYRGYSALVLSLIPFFITTGVYENNIISGDYNAQLGWGIASGVCTGISILCGGYFVYELIRYFIAADSVIPAKAKVTKKFDLVPIPDNEENENSENIEKQEVKE